MAVNRYDNPAQAQFINTYVPIPFEQLYTLGKEAKAEVDKALNAYTTALDKWGEFRSPSEKDTREFYDETYGRALPVAEELARNIDLIKTPEGRAKIFSVINNTDRAKLSMLKQSADNLRSRQQINAKLMMEGKYNPLWHSVDFTNYSTTDSGIYNDLSPLAYKSEVDLVKPFVDNLKPSSLGTEGGYLMHGVSQEAVKAQVDKNLSSILNTPEAQKHIQVLMSQGMSKDAATNAFVNNIYTAANEFTWKDRSGVDAFALEAMRQQGELNKLRAKNGEAGTAIPDTYSRIQYELGNAEAEKLYSSPIFENSRAARAAGNEAILSLQNAYQAGSITQDQYIKGMQEIQAKEAKMAPEYAKAYQQDIRNAFYRNSYISPETGVASDRIADYYSGANRTLDEITYSIPGTITNAYNMHQATSKIEISDRGVPTTGYVSPSSVGMILSSDYVNKLMGVAPQNVKYMVKDKSDPGLERNFAEDLKRGVFKNVIRIPMSTGMNTVVDGKSAIVQRMRVKIPKSTLEAAGYDIDDFNERIANNTNNHNKEYTLGMDWLNADTFGETNINIKVDDKNNTLNDTYYTFDVMEVMPPNGTNRVLMDQEANDVYGGSKMQNEQYGSTLIDTFGNINFQY